MRILSIARTWIDSKNILEATVMIFLLGTYFFPTENSLKNFYYAAILLPYLLTVTVEELKWLLRSKLFVAICVFILYVYLTISWNPATRQSEYFSYFARAINVLVFIGVLCRLVNRDEKYLSKLFIGVVYVAGFMAVVSIGVFYTDHLFLVHRLQNWGALSHNNGGAACYGLAAVVCYCHFLSPEQGDRDWRFALILAVLLIDIGLTMCRGVWLALVLTFAFAQIMRGRYFSVIALLFVVIAYVLLVQMDVIESSWYFARDGGGHFRFAAWDKAMERIAQAPWFGYGVNTDETLKLTIENNRILSHAHSVYVSHLIYGGVVGGILLATAVLLSLIEGIRHNRVRHDITYAALVLFALVCVATAHHHLLLNPSRIWFYFWFPIGMVAALTTYSGLVSKTSFSTLDIGNHVQNQNS